MLTIERNDGPPWSHYSSAIRGWIVTETDLGPGIDVIVGNKFGKLAKAKRVLVAQSSSSCGSKRPTDADHGTDAG